MRSNSERKTTSRQDEQRRTSCAVWRMFLPGAPDCDLACVVFKRGWILFGPSLFCYHIVSPYDRNAECAESSRWKKTGGFSVVKVVQSVPSNWTKPTRTPESWKMRWSKDETNRWFPSTVPLFQDQDLFLPLRVRRMPSSKHELTFYDLRKLSQLLQILDSCQNSGTSSLHRQKCGQ